MTSEQLLQVLGQIDDDLVTEVRRPTRRSALLRSLSAAAAALVVCAGILSAPHLFPAAQRSADDDTKDQLDKSNTGMLADDMTAPIPFDAESRAPEAQTSSDTAAKGDGAAVIPAITVGQGTYLLTDIQADISALPADAVLLGRLTADPDRDLSTTCSKLANCPVWQSSDGKALYIQTEGKGWLTAHIKP